MDDVQLKAVLDQVRADIRYQIRNFESRDALLALASVEGILMEAAAAMMDGSNGQSPDRVQQAQNDAAIVSAFGMAIRDHRRDAMSRPKLV